MIAVLGVLADVERDVRTCGAEGRSQTHKRGQRMGGPPKLTAAQQAEARLRRAESATLKEPAESHRRDWRRPILARARTRPMGAHDQA